MGTRRKIFGFLFAITLAVLSSFCSGTIYKVGDSDGWSPDHEVNYSWVKGKEFHVGDSLVFDYDRKVKDVIQVWDDLEYTFCHSSSPKAVYNTGHDVVTFKEPGHHYFITSNHDQCSRGNKLDVLVVYDLIPPPLRYNAAHLPFGKIFRVGNGRGWGIPKKANFYSKWSNQRQFEIGDSLLFEYDRNHEDVSEISSELEFKSCQSTSLVSVHKTGHDIVMLTKPGVHFFISTKLGHCSAGVKLQVFCATTAQSRLLTRIFLRRWSCNLLTCRLNRLQTPTASLSIRLISLLV